MSKNEEKNFKIYSIGGPVPPEVVELVQGFLDNVLEDSKDDGEHLTLEDITKETADELLRTAKVANDLSDVIKGYLKENREDPLDPEGINDVRASIQALKKVFEAMAGILKLTDLAFGISLSEAKKHDNPTYEDFFS